MIKIISDEINDFLEFLNAEYPRDESFYLHICEGHDSIQDPYTKGIAFGMFGRENDECYVAGDLETEQILKTIAHEYKHFSQKYKGEDFNKEASEDFAEDVYKIFTCEIRNISEDCCDCVFCDKEERYNVS